ATNLIADSTYVTGAVPVTVSGAASIAQLTSIDGKTTGTLTVESINDTSANLIADSTYLTGAVPVTVSGTVSLSDLTDIDAKTTGKVTVIELSDTAANLVTSGVASVYIGEGSNVTITDAVTIAQLQTIDAANGNGTLTYTTITDTNANLTAIGASAYYTGIHANTNVVVTDAVTVAQLTSLDTANGTGTVTYTTDLNDTALALATDAATNAGAGTFTAGRAVTVSDNASIAQLATIDAAATTVTYAGIKDSAANLITNTGAYVLASTVVTVDGSATLAQLKSIDNVVTPALVYTSIADTAANLSANTDGYVTGSVAVKVTDTGSLAATSLTSIDALTTTQVDATTVTGLTGNFAAVDSVLKATGIQLSGSEKVNLTDTAAALNGKTLALTSTATTDELHVGLTSTSIDLSKITGFEDIYLAGSGRFTQTITVGDGNGVTVHAATLSNVIMGTGQQTFDSSAGNDTVLLKSGSTFSFAATAALNGNDTLNGFITGASNSTLNFNSFLGNGYNLGTEIVNSGSNFGGAAGSATLVDGLSVAQNGGFGLQTANTISVADFTGGYLSAVNGKEVLVTIDNTAHKANVYFVDSSLGGSATAVDSASDIVQVATITLTGNVTTINDLHTTGVLVV
ncbi:hypothetical protein SAMN05216593_11971, partial [Pseudomonas asturiensis]